ncbi:MAG: hypothetical protein ACH37Z_07500 [Anaerolineae bacterium]|nr:hypothetical protein [Ardenticatenia bacterium]HQZ70228.1 hypothetical protein [Anaerolineae bacterium]
MHLRTDIQTPFHIDLDWWSSHGRSLDRYLREILGGQAAEDGNPAALVDYIDPQTAEVFQLTAMWTQVLTQRAHRADFITSTMPMTNAVLRALIENRNRPMSAVQIHRRINRGSPQALLRVLQSAHQQYGIAPARGDKG